MRHPWKTVDTKIEKEEQRRSVVKKRHASLEKFFGTIKNLSINQSIQSFELGRLSYRKNSLWEKRVTHRYKEERFFIRGWERAILGWFFEGATLQRRDNRRTNIINITIIWTTWTRRGQKRRRSHTKNKTLYVSTDKT